MVIKYHNIFHSKALQIYPNRDFWFENKPSGNPLRLCRKFQPASPGMPSRPKVPETSSPKRGRGRLVSSWLSKPDLKSWTGKKSGSVPRRIVVVASLPSIRTSKHPAHYQPIKRGPWFEPGLFATRTNQACMYWLAVLLLDQTFHRSE
jgi:hypothetical protein